MEKTIVLKSSQLKKSHKNVHEPYEYYKQEITKREDFNQCYAAIYELPPKKSSYPFHYHEKNTELFYILSGHGLLRTFDGEIAVEEGDVIVCPPGEKGGHKMTNCSEHEILRYLDVDTTTLPTSYTIRIPTRPASSATTNPVCSTGTGRKRTITTGNNGRKLSFAFCPNFRK